MELAHWGLALTILLTIAPASAGGDPKADALQGFLDQCVDEPGSDAAISAASEWDRLVEMGYTPDRIRALVQGLDDDCAYATLGAAVTGEETRQRRAEGRSARVTRRHSNWYVHERDIHLARALPHVEGSEFEGDRARATFWGVCTAINFALGVGFTAGALLNGGGDLGDSVLLGGASVVAWGLAGTFGVITVALTAKLDRRYPGRRSAVRSRVGPAPPTLAVGATGLTLRF